MTRSSVLAAGASDGSCISATSVEVKIVARMLLKSWAMPLARVPTAFSFSAWRSSASSERCVRDVAGQQHEAAVGHPGLAHPHPATVGQMLLVIARVLTAHRQSAVARKSAPMSG